jgi:hypothetical protein
VKDIILNRSIKTITATVHSEQRPKVTSISDPLTMGIQRIDDPLLLYADLNENNTRYDYALAAPSEKELHIQFLVLAIVNAIVATACFILILAICCSKKVRTIPFNLYILAMTIPDFLVSFFCLITCAMSAPGGAYVSEAMCTFQAFYLPFGFAANCWMNAVITYQIHKLLKHSRACRRYVPPTRVGIAKQTIAVYLYACIVATIGLFDLPWLHKGYLVRGFACFPMEHDYSSAFVYWLLFIPAMLGLPIIYAAYVTFDICKRSLLPKEGRRHSLAVYYFRLVLVYFGMWVPFILFLGIANFIQMSPWVFWVASTWSHLQGLVSALVAILTKKDINQAVANLLHCRWEDDEGSSRWGKSRNSFMKSMRSAPMRPPREQAPTSDTRVSLALSKASEALQDDYADRDHESVRGGDKEDAQQEQKDREDDDLDLENAGDVAREEICHENSVLKSSLETDALS